jgi:hypothetical protein
MIKRPAPIEELPAGARPLLQNGTIRLYVAEPITSFPVDQMMTAYVFDVRRPTKIHTTTILSALKHGYWEDAAGPILESEKQ